MFMKRKKYWDFLANLETIGIDADLRGNDSLESISGLRNASIGGVFIYPNAIKKDPNNYPIDAGVS